MRIPCKHTAQAKAEWHGFYKPHDLRRIKETRKQGSQKLADRFEAQMQNYEWYVEKGKTEEDYKKYKANELEIWREYAA